MEDFEIQNEIEEDSASVSFTMKIVAILVAVVVVAMVLSPVLYTSAHEVVAVTKSNGHATGYELSYFTPSADVPEYTLTVAFDGTNVSATGMGTKTAEDMIIMVSNDQALIVQGGRMYYINGTVTEETDTMTLTLTPTELNGLAYQWVYFPESNGKYASFPDGVQHQSDTVVGVGTFAGASVINRDDSILNGNPYQLVVTAETESGTITGFVYGIEHDDDYTVGQPGTPVTADPSDGVLIGDLYYVLDGTEATVVGYSSTIDWTTFMSIPDTVSDGTNTYTVTAIGEFAFQSCSELALTELPSGLISIGNLAFLDCTSLAITSFPDGLQHIYDSAFWGCTGLTDLVIPESVTILGSGAFYGCIGLKNIIFQATIIPFNADAFYYCINVEQVLNLGYGDVKVLGREYESRSDVPSTAIIQEKEYVVYETVTKDGLAYPIILILPIFAMLGVLVYALHLLGFIRVDEEEIIE